MRFKPFVLELQKQSQLGTSMLKNVFKVLRYLYYLGTAFKFKHKQSSSGMSPNFVN